MLVGELLEIGSAVELLDDLVGLFLGLHENVTGVHLVDRRLRGDFLLVAGAQFLVGDLADHLLLDHLAVQGALLEKSGAALEVRILSRPSATALAAMILISMAAESAAARRCSGGSCANCCESSPSASARSASVMVLPPTVATTAAGSAGAAAGGGVAGRLPARRRATSRTWRGRRRDRDRQPAGV